MAAELPAGAVLRFTVSSSTLNARVIPPWQFLLQHWIASSLRTVQKHRTVSAAFTAAELNCDSNEECTRWRRGVGLSQHVGGIPHERSLCCLTPKLSMVVVLLC